MHWYMHKQQGRTVLQGEMHHIEKSTERRKLLRKNLPARIGYMDDPYLVNEQE